MRKVVRFGVAAGCCSLLASCVPFHMFTPTGTAPLRYRDKVFTTVDVTNDITYGQAPDLAGVSTDLKLDLYQPHGDTVAARPAIVWVHGGGFNGGDRTSGELVDEAHNFGEFGYVSVSIDYRMGKGCQPVSDECVAGIAMAKHDAQAAVRWLRANASTYHIDPKRIAVGGSSAGAITAYNVAYGSEDVGRSGNAGFSSKVLAAVSLSGAALNESPAPGDPPTLDFHGTADDQVPYAWAQGTIAAALQANDIAESTVWPGAGHVPYGEHHDEIIDQTRNFLYAAMDLGQADH